MEISKVIEEEQNVKVEDSLMDSTSEASHYERKLTKRTSFKLEDEAPEIENHLEFHIKAHDIDEVGEFTFAKHKISHISQDEDQSIDQQFQSQDIEEDLETAEGSHKTEHKRSLRFEDIPAHTNSSTEFVQKAHEFEKGEFLRDEES